MLPFCGKAEVVGRSVGPPGRGRSTRDCASAAPAMVAPRPAAPGAAGGGE
ncbi:hypothetical protein AB5I41_12900 [Sphingomonas sp. MMS24-JH45]